MKRIAFLCYSRVALVLITLLCNGELFGQDTVSLRAVDVGATKFNVSQTGKKLEHSDSLTKEQFRFQNVSELLSATSGVFIKNYGPGAISTTAFRGGNASQTAVLWNGFNIQNTMLGQNDLSLLPSYFFEDIAVEYGGSSALWGSGAVGGSIHLNNKTKFNKGLNIGVNVGGNSIGQKNAAGIFSYSRKKMISTTKLYLTESKNNFQFKDTLDQQNPLKTMQHAGYKYLGLLQELRFILGEKQTLSLNVWTAANTRHIPAYNYNVVSKTFQMDQFLRTALNWAYQGKKMKSNINGAVFFERLDYNDSLIKSYSKNNLRTAIFENENYYRWKNSLLNFGVNITSTEANADNYVTKKQLHRLSLLAGNKFYINDRATIYAGLRAEYFSVGALPITYNLSAELKVSKHIRLMANSARVYRQPTLNELYWTPGGNINLKPEEGFTHEGTIVYSREIASFGLSISGSAYSRKIENWILWIPGANGNPTPVNLQKVWSRGTESSFKLRYTKNKFICSMTLGTNYVLSTIAENTQESNNTEGAQLIYTPRYTANGNIMFGYKNLSIHYFQQYCGYRFTTSDNSQWLLPYHTSSIKMNLNFEFKSTKMTAFGSCNNLFNSNYMVVIGRPMPLRYYEAGLSIHLNHKNK